MKYLILGLLLAISCNTCFADNFRKLTAMNINLPEGMHEEFQKEKNGVYLYMFSSPTMQLKITALDKAPDNTTEVEAWQKEKLGQQITFWREGSLLPLDKQNKALSEKPKLERIGKYVFKSVEMSFDTQDVKFMNAVSDHGTYMLTIISTAKDSKQRQEDIKKFSDLMNHIELKPLPLSIDND